MKRFKIINKQNKVTHIVKGESLPLVWWPKEIPKIWIKAKSDGLIIEEDISEEIKEGEERRKASIDSQFLDWNDLKDVDDREILEALFFKLIKGDSRKLAKLVKNGGKKK